jgi:hypothetical protein
MARLHARDGGDTRLVPALPAGTAKNLLSNFKDSKSCRKIFLYAGGSVNPKGL